MLPQIAFVVCRASQGRCVVVVFLCLLVCVCVCVCLCACPRYGIKQKRVVAVDGVAKELYNFDRHLRVRKKLPLEQLVQVLGVWCYR